MYIAEVDRLEHDALGGHRRLVEDGCRGREECARALCGIALTAMVESGPGGA